MDDFCINWVIKNQISIGRSPIIPKDFGLIKSNNIKSILTLCDLNEVNLVIKDFEGFFWKQIVLPDHTYEKKLTYEDLDLTLNCLSELNKNGSVFIHCKAGYQRSPLICMAWLMQNKKLSLDSALIYIRQIHPMANPMKEHLNLLRNYFS